MLDLPDRIERARVAAAMRLAALGIGTFVQLGAGFLVALIAVPLIAAGHSWIALPVLLAGLGLMAVAGTGASARVAELSSAFALIVLAGLPFAFALNDPARALAAIFLMFGMTAAGAASLFANAGRGLARTDTALCICAFAFACLLPVWFSLVAYALGLSCFMAAGARIALAVARSGG